MSIAVTVPPTRRVSTLAEDARVRRVLRPILRSWLRLHVEGADHLPDGPVLIASTHTSHADSLAIGTAAPRPVFFLGDEHLLDWPIVGRWLPDLGMVAVRRGQGDTAAMSVVTDLLAEGHAVTVFPEGSRSRDGAVHRPRSGVARMAATAGVPVVPAAVVGAAKVWPVDRWPRPRGRVTVRFGEPMDTPGTTPRQRRRFGLELHDALVELSGAPRSDSFAPAGGGQAET